MKPRSQRIDVVIELAQRDEDAAAEQFSAAKQALNNAQQQLEELQEYYQGYVNQFGKQTQGLTASDLSNSRAFLLQLSLAAVNQQQQITVLEQRLQQMRQVWHRTHLKTQSLRDLQLRYRREEAEAMDRKEQKQLDEWVNQRR